MRTEIKPLHIVQLGMGNVGRAFARQLGAARHRLPWLTLVGVADRSGLCLNPQGLTPATCESAIRAKDSESTLAAWHEGQPGSEFLPAEQTYSPALAAHLDGLGIGRIVVVDLTGSQDLYPMHLSLRKSGHHIVLANKWPLAVPYPQYLDLWRSGDGFLLHEVTVGAALPVIRPLENLVATGDVIHEITASISGTMGYVTSAIQSGTSFSQALSQAAQMGYTEPDPRLDLGGVDARRKALILARKIGEPIDLEDVSVTSLVPPELEKVSLDEFWARLPGEDARLRDLVEEAAGKGEVLRYLANIRPGSAPRVSLVAVPVDSVFASTMGTESLFAFSTSRYNEQPLVVRGQGAGGELTAGGVLADILSMRGEQIGMV
jgi:homoserine dehydrogenase